MDTTRVGFLSLKFNEARLSVSSSIYQNHQFYLKISFGGQYFTTSTSVSSAGLLKWEDSLKLMRTSEETICVECWMINNSTDYKVASALVPIQTAVIQGKYKGMILLAHKGKVYMRLSVDFSFEEKRGLRIEHPTVVYPVPPPEHPHVHAYSVPPNFTYTPPGYYHGRNGADKAMN
jgi:hypothetical protein